MKLLAKLLIKSLHADEVQAENNYIIKAKALRVSSVSRPSKSLSESASTTRKTQKGYERTTFGVN